MNIKYISFNFFVVLLALSIMLFTVTDAEEYNDKKAEMAWVQQNKGNYDIEYAYYDGKSWKGNLLLSTGNDVNFVPVMANTKSGQTWLVWSSDTSSEYHLYYAVIDGDKIIQGPTLIQTSLKSNATPSLLIDTNDTPWIAWSGNNGMDDEIYYSKFNGQKWMGEKLLHKANSVPDIFPELSVSEDGRIGVSWTTFGKNGSEKVYSIIQHGTDGRSIAGLDTITLKKNEKQIVGVTIDEPLVKAINACVPNFPNTIKNIDFATLQLRCGDRTRLVQFVGKKLHDSQNGAVNNE